MNTGKVKWFDAAKGYGFIVPAKGGEDVFVHIRELSRSGLDSLNEGDAVRFELAPSQRKPGKMTAVNLSVSA